MAELCAPPSDTPVLPTITLPGDGRPPSRTRSPGGHDKQQVVDIDGAIAARWRDVGGAGQARAARARTPGGDHGQKIVDIDRVIAVGVRRACRDAESERVGS